MTDATATQLSAEAWVSTGTATAVRHTQTSVEAWVRIQRPNVLWATQATAEAWVRIQRPNKDWVTQIAIEAWILVRSVTDLTYPIYPTDLPGLGYDVSWKPEFANVPTAVAANKGEIDLALADTPVHEFTLTYNFLRNQVTYLQSSITNEFKRLFGFFLRLGGNAGRFLFENPDDNSVVGEVVATTDGTTTDYGPIQRTFGVGSDSGTEPVGYVNLTQPVHVYLDGVEAGGGAYTIDRTYPLNQRIVWLLPPAAAQVMTIDCSYYYYCKFAEDNMSFEKFMSLLWTVKQVRIRSNRAGT